MSLNCDDAPNQTWRRQKKILRSLLLIAGKTNVFLSSSGLGSKMAVTEGEVNSLLSLESQHSSLTSKSVTPPGQTAQGDGSLTVPLEVSHSELVECTVEETEVHQDK